VHARQLSQSVWRLHKFTVEEKYCEEMRGHNTNMTRHSLQYLRDRRLWKARTDVATRP